MVSVMHHCVSSLCVVARCHVLCSVPLMFLICSSVINVHTVTLILSGLLTFKGQD